MDNHNLTQKEYEELMSQLKAVDIHNEFREEWKNDIRKVKSYIKLRMRSVLPEYGEKFYQYVSRLRDLKGLTNAILARRMGLDDSYLSKYLNGKGITKENALALLIALDLEAPQLQAAQRLADIRLDDGGFGAYNDIVNYYLEHSDFSNGKNPIAECNQELLEFGFDSLTKIGTPDFGK